MPFGRAWTRVAPKRCPLAAKWFHLGPECVLRAEAEKWPYLGLDGPNCKSVDTFPTVQTSTLSDFHPSEWPKRTATSSFCPPGAHLAAFWGFLACVCPPKRGQHGQKGSKMTLSRNATGPLGLSSEVFLARSEAPLDHFDHRRVVCFPHPHCAVQTVRALQKEVNGVQWCCTERRETHPLQLGPNTKS